MKNLIFFVVFITVAVLLNGCSAKLGSYQEDKKYDLLAQEISKQKAAAEDLEKIVADSAKKSSVKTSELVALNKKIKVLEARKDSIFDRYTSSTEIPDELTSCELKARRMANVAKREKMVLDKIRANINNPGLVDSAGYKVIVKNNYYKDVNFIICPRDGGDKISVYLGGNEKNHIFLLPGVYSICYQVNGNNMGQPTSLHIDGSVHLYEGEKCFGYIFTSRND
jgi:hypothetical protein